VAKRPPARTEAAKRALRLLRTCAASAQRDGALTDAQMDDILGSLRATYARRARAVELAKEEAE